MWFETQQVYFPSLPIKTHQYDRHSSSSIHLHTAIVFFVKSGWLTEVLTPGISISILEVGWQHRSQMSTELFGFKNVSVHPSYVTVLCLFPQLNSGIVVSEMPKLITSWMLLMGIWCSLWYLNVSSLTMYRRWIPPPLTSVLTHKASVVCPCQLDIPWLFVWSPNVCVLHLKRPHFVTLYHRNWTQTVINVNKDGEKWNTPTPHPPKKKFSLWG